MSHCNHSRGGADSSLNIDRVFDMRIEAGIERSAGFLLGKVLVSFAEPAAMVDTTVVDAEGLHHAVAVEPVTVAKITDIVLSGAVSVERPAEV